MARYHASWTVAVRGNGAEAILVEDALVAVLDASTGDPIPWYPSASGGTVSSDPVRTNSAGVVSVWVEEALWPATFRLDVSTDASTVRAGTGSSVTFPAFTKLALSDAGAESVAGAVLLLESELGLADTAVEVALSHDELDAQGLTMFPDGSWGVAFVAGAPMLWAPNGGASARVTYDGGGDLVALDTAIPIGSMIQPADYAAFGPVYHDTGTGTLFAIYHGEIHAPGNPQVFWAFLGVATADDSAPTVWTDRGRIITPDRDEATSLATGLPTDVGGGPYRIPGDGFIYVYFKDTLVDGTWTACSVARCALVDFLDAETTTPVFSKWDGVGWTEPGIGGVSESIIDQSIPTRWLEVVGTSDGRTLMVASIHDGDYWHLAYLVSESNPFGSFVGPVPITVPSLNERVYPTVLGPTMFGVPRTIDLSNDNQVLFTDSAVGGFDRWDDAQVLSILLPKTLRSNAAPVLERLDVIEATVLPDRLRMVGHASVAAVPNPHTENELAIINGKLQMCTASGSPGTWQVVGAQS